MGKIAPAASPTHVFPREREKGRIACRPDNIRMNVHTSVSSLDNIQNSESFRSGQETDLWIYNHFPIKSRNTIDIKKVTFKMVGAVHFRLEPPGAGRGQVARATMPTIVAWQAGLRGAGASGVVPIPPWLTYAPYPVTYTQPWVTKTTGRGAANLDKGFDSYRDTFPGNPVEYVTIITPPSVNFNCMVFLAVLDGDQVCTVK